MAQFAQTVDDLNNNFGLPGVLTFDQHGELVRARISLPECTAEVYLQGAHLTYWQPTGSAPVIFLSSRSEFAPGKAIRGGIPVCFPWFGPDTQARAAGKPGPSHGFARTSEWTLALAALEPPHNENEHAALNLIFTLAPTPLSRSLGFSNFRVVYQMTFSGASLTLRFSVANEGPEPLTFEEALHTYFAVSEVREAVIEGLAGARYLDKTDGMQEKIAPEGAAPLSGWTDRVYPDNAAEVRIDDDRRTIFIEKQNSRTTVLWNPWAELATGMADLGPDEWQKFVCIESANTGSDAVTLAQWEIHRLETRITPHIATAR